MKRREFLTAALGLTLSSTAPALAQTELTIAVAAPFTGANAAFGLQYRNGAEQAAADLNAKGGVLGRRIVLRIEDDASDPKQGVSIANRLVGQNVGFVVGHFNSGVVIPTSEVYAEGGAISITPSGTNPRITERGLWNTFRVCGRDDQQGSIAVDYIAGNFRGKRIAIVHDKTTYGNGIAQETKKGLNAKGITETLLDSVTAGDKDFSALVTRMKSLNIDLLYYGGLHNEAGLIVRQMREQGLNAPLMGGDGLATSEFATIAGTAAEGSLMTFSPDPRKNPAAKDILARFRAKNIEPEAYTLYSYAAMQVLADAMQRAGSVEPRKVAEEMRKGAKFDTVLGALGFDKKGDITRPDFIVYAWRRNTNGAITYENNEVTQLPAN